MEAYKTTSSIISTKVDEYLQTLGFYEGSPVDFNHPEINGWCKRYDSEFSTYRVCITKEGVFISKEYNGEYSTDQIPFINKDCLYNKEIFHTEMQNIIGNVTLS